MSGADIANRATSDPRRHGPLADVDGLVNALSNLKVASSVSSSHSLGAVCCLHTLSCYQVPASTAPASEWMEWMQKAEFGKDGL
eukprot:1197573-Rhodomonas_salina.5